MNLWGKKMTAVLDTLLLTSEFTEQNRTTQNVPYDYFFLFCIHSILQFKNKIFFRTEK